MNENRVGFGARLGAAALDVVLAGIAATVILVLVATAGGVGLGLRYQEITGGKVSLRSFFDGSLGRQITERSDRLTREIEDELGSRLTPEQARRLGEVVGREMERMFLPVEMGPRDVWPTFRRFLTIGESTLGEAVDRAFQAAADAKIEGVTTQDLEAIRADVDALVRDLGLAKFLPDVVRYAVGVALSPLVAVLVYGLVEAFAGASLGKLLLGIRIGDLEGRRAGLGLTVARYLVKSSGWILVAVALAARQPMILPFAAAEYAVIFFGALAMLGPEKRALHDYMVGTAIYRSSEMTERT